MCNQTLSRKILVNITQAIQDNMAWVIDDNAILLASNDYANEFMQQSSLSYQQIFYEWEPRLKSLIEQKTYFAPANRVISKNSLPKTWFTVYKLKDNQGDYYWIRAIKDFRHRSVFASQTLLKNIINHLPHYIFWKNAHSEFLGCNQAFASMLGLKRPDEIIGKNDYELPWLTQQAAQYRHDDFEIINTKRPKLFYEEKQHDREGSERIVLVSKIPLLSEQKPIKADGIACIYQDITEMKRLETALMNSIQRAQESNKKKSEFIANISHDLRTPITGMLGLAEYIKDNAQHVETKEYAEYIIRSTQALLTRLNDVINWIENDENLDKMESEVFQLNHIVWQNIILLNPAIKLRGMTITYDEGVFNTHALYGRKICIDRIILNLLSLSVRLAEDGEIKISTHLLDESSHAKTLQICIQDHQENHQANHRENPSNQINLRWVQHYVNDLNGEFLFDHYSIDGKHKYVINIPLETNHQASSKLALLSDVKKQSDGRKILVIDNSSLACLGHQRILEQFFCDIKTLVITASNKNFITDIHIDNIVQNRFDLVFIGQITDYKLLLDKLIKKLKSSNPKIKVIGLSHAGYGHDNLSHDNLSHDNKTKNPVFTRILQKPLTAQKIQQFLPVII